MDKIIELAKKLHALAQQGEGGEKENAVKMLEALMKKHGITIDMIDSEDQVDHYFEIIKSEERLLIQIARHVSNTCRIYDTRKNKRAQKYLLMIITCTQAQALEIRAKFEFYKVVYEKDLATFYKAFIHKNKLLAESIQVDDTEPVELTPEEKAEAFRIRNMMEGMQRHHFHKQIENPKKSS